MKVATVNVMLTEADLQLLLSTLKLQMTHPNEVLRGERITYLYKLLECKEEMLKGESDD